jgi:16S rRNA (guanine966-N2)-methyltransferase
MSRQLHPSQGKAAGIMRVIAGELKGKRLVSFTGRSIRPTSERAREAVFNILGDRVRGAVVLELFAGTGAFSIEALSRGATSAVMIERSREALQLIGRNLAACRLAARARVIRWDITRNIDCLRHLPDRFELVFIDPPYQQGAIGPCLQHLIACGALAPGASVVIEHAPREVLPAESTPLRLSDRRKYGKALVSFFTYVL